MAYSMDLWQQVIDDCDAGLGTKVVAQKYRASTHNRRYQTRGIGGPAA